MRLQPIYDIAELCGLKGVKNAVLCPGSRCAPLTLAFVRNNKIETKTISDERSAAFIALGMTQQTGTPTVLICTSGSATYNFAPAIAEAYFSNIPLVIFTADRPKEWISQQDGQTIFQDNLYGKHVKKYFALPQDYEHPDSKWGINRIVNDAINLAVEEPKGPVHINVPLREPLYPEVGEEIQFTNDLRIICNRSFTAALPENLKIELLNEWSQHSRILIVAGQHDFDQKMVEALDALEKNHDIPVVGDIISNLHTLENGSRHADIFLNHAPEKIKNSLQPDLLITFGKSIISKNLKLYLRKFKAKTHWHIQPAGEVADTYQSITKIIRTSPTEFFEFMNSVEKLKGFESQKQNNYKKLWEIEERRIKRVFENFFPQEELGEIELVREIINNLPADSSLHLANSMAVRYANMVGISHEKENVRIFSNRGTSGIDGCTSTTIGHTLTTEKPQFLVTGDMAFFYDRNAFWHNYPIPNLRIVVLNNHGGIIFSMIDGPASLEESREYFVTQQNLNAKSLCEEFDFDYLFLDHRRKLKNFLKDFFDLDGRTKVLELDSSIELNKKLIDKLKEKIKSSYEL